MEFLAHWKFALNDLIQVLKGFRVI